VLSLCAKGGSRHLENATGLGSLPQQSFVVE
jgi:hypothetical protein